MSAVIKSLVSKSLGRKWRQKGRSNNFSAIKKMYVNAVTIARWTNILGLKLLQAGNTNKEEDPGTKVDKLLNK